jgi:putative FmdB family regulatory protein
VPLYEYQCPKCGRFELIRKFADPPLATCPTCGAEVQKLLSAPAIQFKGAGWYITDYARKGSGGDGEKKAAGAESGGSEGGSKDSASKDGGSKDGGGKDSGSKDGGSKDSSAKSEGSTATSGKDTSSKPA